MKVLSVKANVENLDQVIGFVENELEAAECPMKPQMQIVIAVEEIFVNVAHYAYKDAGGEGDVEIAVEAEGGTVRIRFTDTGVAYDPLKKDDPDITKTAEERDIGGLGIFMVKKSMDLMEYERAGEANVLTIEKKI